MDRTGIIVVTACVILLGFWLVTEQKYASQRLQQQTATNAVAVPQQETKIAAAAFPTPVTSPIFSFDTNAPEELKVITNAHARYTFTSRGGGLKSVELLDYPETISARWKQKTSMSMSGVATLNTHALVPVLAILGESNLVGDGNFTLKKIDDGVRAEKSFTNGLRIVKEFRVGSNYLVDATVRLENTSGKSLSLPAQEWVVGTATPMGPDDNGQNEGVMWFDGTGAQVIGTSYFNTNTTFFRRTTKSEYCMGSGNVAWAAVHNQFFALMAMPNTNQPAQQIIARPVALPQFSNIERMANAPLPQGIQTALIYPTQTLEANSAVERRMVLFAGPKEYRTLARIGTEFQNHADLVMNFGAGFASFWGIGTFFAKVLLWGMNWLHDVTHAGYGLVIVLFTVIIKAILWPLMTKSTRSMKRMQALAPEIQALKAKYKDDPQKFTQKQMELWKKNKVSPVSGCLPMLIQMPIFIGFFTMIRSAIELRGAHFLWVADLSKPDTLFMIPGLTFIPFISTPEGLPFNLLPLLMGGAMLWQSHLTPPSPGMDQTQAKMMRYLPLMFLVFLYTYSSGLTLYWTINNLLTILQTKLTKMNQAPVAPGVTPTLPPPSKKKK